MINETDVTTKSREKSWSRPPTKSDIKETRDLLHDFGIHIIIPECASKSQLYEWRRKMIMNKLNRMEGDI